MSCRLLASRSTTGVSLRASLVTLLPRSGLCKDPRYLWQQFWRWCCPPLVLLGFVICTMCLPVNLREAGLLLGFTRLWAM